MENRPQIKYNSAIFQEPVNGKYGEKAGGAAGVALAHALNLPGGRVVAPRNGTHVEPGYAHYFFDKPDAPNNDVLLETLSNDRWLDHFNGVFNGEVNEGHYYVAGDVLRKLGKLHAYMGHSWDRVVGMMDPGRSVTSTREQAELGIIQSAKALIVSTQAEKDGIAIQYAADTGLTPEEIANKTHVIPLGADHEKFNLERASQLRGPAREKYLGSEFGDENNVVFYTLGRMSGQKGHLEAVQSVADVLQQCPDLPISLSVIGGPLEGSYYNEVEDFYKGLDPQIQRRILFHGALPADHAHAFGDVLLGPSTWETWFLSMTEAMACAKPVVVSDIPQMPILNQVAKEGGIYVPRTDINQWSNVIHQLAVNPGMREELGRMNMNTALGYTWEKTGAQLEQVLQSIQ